MGRGFPKPQFWFLSSSPSPPPSISLLPNLTISREATPSGFCLEISAACPISWLTSLSSRKDQNTTSQKFPCSLVPTGGSSGWSSGRCFCPGSLRCLPGCTSVSCCHPQNAGPTFQALVTDPGSWHQVCVGRAAGTDRHKLGGADQRSLPQAFGGETPRPRAPQVGLPIRALLQLGDSHQPAHAHPRSPVWAVRSLT